MSDVLRIPVYKSTHLYCWALVEAEDYPTAICWRWCAMTKDRYASTTIEGRTILMHRLIMGCVAGDGLTVDHRNGDGFDNRRVNLRICTRAENAQNVRKRRGTLSRYRGVTPNGRRWMAQAGLAGRRHYLGTFDTEEEAAVVADAFRREHFSHYEGRDR